MSTRRVFLGALVGGALASPLGARAQAPARIPRIGFLATASLDSPEMRLSQAALREGLRERGYVEGQNIAIEYRLADGNVGRFPALAAELVQAKVDIILASNTRAAREALRATRTIPIVVAVMGDPVGDGLVQSLSKPGGNLTGLTFLGPELVPKRLALFKEALPRVTRVAGLWHPGAFGERTNEEMSKQSDASARSLKVQLQYVEVQSGDQLDRAFATVAKERMEGVIVFPSPLLFNERRRTVELAARHRLPVMSNAREYVELGGLMSYGASITDLIRHSAVYVDRILKGAKPGDLPVEQPTKFELLINLKTARALGLTIPPSLLGRADEVIR